MLLAIVLAPLLAQAATPAQSPPSAQPPRAHLVIPKDLEEQRSGRPRDPVLPLFSDPRVHEALGDLKPAAGAWAEYGLHGKGNTLVRVRVSILDEPAPLGFWLEIDTLAPGLPIQSAKLLAHGDPSRPENLDSLELYMAGQAPITMPLDELREKLPKAKPSATPPRIVQKGSETVQVVAGKFTAQRIVVGDTSVWRSSAIPLWGLVKAQSPRETIELLSSGTTGAHSLFPRLDP